MGGWICRHEQKGQCQKVKGKSCDPGMKGCVLYARMKKQKESQIKTNTEPSVEKELKKGSET